MKVIVLVSLLALLGVFAGPAQRVCAQVGVVSSLSRDGNQLNIGLGHDTLSVRVCMADMIQVHYQPNGVSTPETPCMTTTGWAPVEAKFRTDADPIVITTSAMMVTISRSPCRIAVYNKGKKLLVKEQDSVGVSSGGLNLTGAVHSHFFGIHGWEFLDKAGSVQELAPRSRPYRIDAGAEGNTGAPFVWSNQGYGVFVDSVGGQCTISDGDGLAFSGLSRPDVPEVGAGSVQQ